MALFTYEEALKKEGVKSSDVKAVDPVTGGEKESSYLSNFVNKAYGALKGTYDETKEALNKGEQQFAENAGQPGAVMGNVATVGRTLLDTTGAVAKGVGGVITSVVPDWFTQLSEKGSQAFADIGTRIRESDPEMANKLDAVVNEIDNSSAMKSLIKAQQSNPDLLPVLEDAINSIMLGVGLGKGAPKVAEVVTSAKGAVPAVLQSAKEGIQAVSSKASEAVSSLAPDSATIMNRVARLKPSDATKFEKLSGGKTHGDYLAETGNFGTPDQIISNESKKFSESIASVDNELANLPGVYKDGSITDALSGLVEKAKGESGTNVKSPYLARAEELLNKSEAEGLSMKEINEAKRLYEKNVKLGYNKLMNGKEVTMATNVDNALREWQKTKAEKLGFKNIGELNKQTQLSKFIIDKLGDQIVGKEGLNGVGLSDWIILAGGDPTAVGSFLTKKFFSSKGVQSKIADYLFKGERKGQIKPETSFSPESIKRGISPSGLLELPEGKGNPNLKQDMTTIIPQVIKDEGAAAKSTNTTVNKTGDSYVRDRKTGKVKIVPKKK